MANGNLMSTWGAMRTTRDLDDLQRLSNDYARELGMSPDMFPKVIFDRSGLAAKPGYQELGYSTPQNTAIDPRGAPFLGYKNPGGFIALSGDSKNYGDTIFHELSHLRAARDLPIPPQRKMDRNGNMSLPYNYPDPTHGFGPFYGGDEPGNPYYESFLRKDSPMNPWSALRYRK